MSWDVYVIGQIDGHDIELYSTNYTHNTNRMIRDAGFPEFPDRVKGMSAPLFGQLLEGAVRNLRRNPDRYRKMNPPNGWGDYDTLLPVLDEVLAACRRFPSARIEMSA